MGSSEHTHREREKGREKSLDIRETTIRTREWIGYPPPCKCLATLCLSYFFRDVGEPGCDIRCAQCLELKCSNACCSGVGKSLLTASASIMWFFFRFKKDKFQHTKIPMFQHLGWSVWRRTPDLLANPGGSLKKRGGGWFTSPPNSIWNLSLSPSELDVIDRQSTASWKNTGRPTKLKTDLKGEGNERFRLKMRKKLSRSQNKGRTQRKLPGNTSGKRKSRLIQPQSGDLLLPIT